jgi:2-C-methyl-D-erythritol 4-phosphate cytidylyltransferase
MPAFAVIFPAAGRSSRFHGKEKKPFTNLDGRAVWLRSVEQFITRPDVAQCIIVVSPEDQEMFRRRFGANLAFMNVQIANGGAEQIGRAHV